jgi:hypothetical protein
MKRHTADVAAKRQLALAAVDQEVQDVDVQSSTEEVEVEVESSTEDEHVGVETSKEDVQVESSTSCTTTTSSDLIKMSDDRHCLDQSEMN